MKTLPGKTKSYSLFSSYIYYQVPGKFFTGHHRVKPHTKLWVSYPFLRAETGVDRLECAQVTH